MFLCGLNIEGREFLTVCASIKMIAPLDVGILGLLNPTNCKIKIIHYRYLTQDCQSASDI
jgi:hypothetical protein